MEFECSFSVQSASVRACEDGQIRANKTVLVCKHVLGYRYYCHPRERIEGHSAAGGYVHHIHCPKWSPLTEKGNLISQS